jgi:hypothetical protein
MSKQHLPPTKTMPYLPPTKTMPLPILPSSPVPLRGQVVDRNGIRQTNAAAGEIRGPQDLQAGRRCRRDEAPGGRG